MVLTDQPAQQAFLCGDALRAGTLATQASIELKPWCLSAMFVNYIVVTKKNYHTVAARIIDNKVVNANIIVILNK